MPTPDAVARGQRLKEARLSASVVQKRSLSQAAMGALVGAQIGRSISQATWSDYEAGVTEPSLEVIRGAAVESGLSEIYITYGVTLSPIEVPDPTKDHKLTREEEEQALRDAEEEDRVANRRPPKRGGGKP